MSNTREVSVTLHIKIKTTKTDESIKEALTIGTKKGIDNHHWHIMPGDVEIEVKKIKSKTLNKPKKNNNMKLNIKDWKVVTEDDWSKFVEEIYGRPYSLQQQGEKLSKETYMAFPVPYPYTDDDEMNDVSIDELKPEQYGVKFDRWIQEEDIPSKGEGSWYKFRRRFFPDLWTVVNDLHKRGLLEEGYYVILVNW